MTARDRIMHKVLLAILVLSSTPRADITCQADNFAPSIGCNVAKTVQNIGTTTATGGFEASIENGIEVSAGIEQSIGTTTATGGFKASTKNGIEFSAGTKRTTTAASENGIVHMEAGRTMSASSNGVSATGHASASVETGTVRAKAIAGGTFSASITEGVSATGHASASVDTGTVRVETSGSYSVSSKYGVSATGHASVSVETGAVRVEASGSYSASTKDGVNVKGHFSASDSSRRGLNKFGVGGRVGTDGVSGSLEWGHNSDGVRSTRFVQGGLTREAGLSYRQARTETSFFKSTSSESSASLGLTGFHSKSTTTSEGLFTKTSTTKTNNNFFWGSTESKTEVTQGGVKAAGVAGAVATQLVVVAVRCERGTAEECEEAKKDAVKATAVSVAATVPYVGQALLLGSAVSDAMNAKSGEESLEKLAKVGTTMLASAVLGPATAPVLDIAAALKDGTTEQAVQGLASVGFGGACAVPFGFTGPFAVVLAPVAYSACAAIAKVALK